MNQQRSQIARNVAASRLSAIKEMAMRSRGLEGVASLTWGLPSFRTPEHVRAAVSEALAHDPEIGKYSLPNGLPELRELVAREHLARTGVEVDPEANVFISAGNMQGMNSLLRVVLEPGDEILVTDPGFTSHIQQIGLYGGVPVAWPLDEEGGWSLDVERLPELISPRTKGIVLVTPSNPTGAIFAREDLLRVGQIAQERDLLLFLDDPYSSFTYENRADFFDLSTRRELFDRLAYLYTFSKCHAMSGWRLGYMIVPEWLRDEVLKVHDATMICTPRISQVAGISALDGGTEHVQQFERELARRRDLICERLDHVPHVFAYTRPAGAYYVFPRILAEHEDSWEFSLRLLDEIRVAVTPGHAFGPSGEHHVRMAYCVEEDVIHAAFDRIDRLFAT